MSGEWEEAAGGVWLLVGVYWAKEKGRWFDELGQLN